MTDREEQALADAQQWEAAAAELTAAMAFDARTPTDALPPALAERITKAGEAFVRTLHPGVVAGPVVPITVVAPRRGLMTWGGWLAAAAVLAVWVGGRFTSSGTTTPEARVAPSGAALRDSLLAADSALTRLAWSTSSDSSAIGATGDVVWSTRAQRGVMRIAGLQPNDRTRWQYQLWIFDKRRDQRYPVDGGVFDIPAGAREVFVPINARVPVGEAVLFAITIEPPGGVVVSKRERIALLAKPAS